ncbi:MAG: ATP phosphoribosyltransferase regulatory subunit [Candidatus Rokubacteria bacterium RIFCSPHIGHO2_02_FULL_69_13]|nr:MAG: ATP phosphoribosyltransferase regulatory subunit [Candidatus Rokubacteria bacterium RIFCSPHIGHO2_02_FULL_69_13]
MDKRAFRTQLPKGVKIYLPDEAAAKRSVEQRLLSVFTRWGYREVVTPTYEFADVLSVGTDETLQGEMFKLVDRDTGRMLALRADITPQIARIVATRLRDEPKPLRLAYVANVFRYEEPQVGRYREFYQAGVELVGLEKPEADAEMIAMTVEGLQALGLDRFQINVGQADFFRGVLEELKIDRERGRQLQEALSRKDASTLERLVKDLAPPASTAELLVALPDLFGREEVLERGARLVKNPRSDRALANLAEVHRLLRAYGLADAGILDLGEVRGFDYYSGVHFEGYVSGLGAPLCGGGRYDQMLGRFGYDCPATGFAFEVGRALLAMEAQGVAVPLAGPDFFIIDFTPEKTVALSLSRRLRDLGAAVARDIITRGLPESLAYARGQRARWALVIGGPKTRAEEVLAIELATGAEQKIRAADLLEAPAKWFPVGGAHA